MSNKTSSVAPGAASPVSDRRHTDSSTTRTSVAELSHQFERHNLRTQAPSPCSACISPLRGPERSLQSGATPTNMYSNVVRQQRTTLSRHQRTSADLGKTSSLAEDVPYGESQRYRTYLPLSNDQSSDTSRELSSYNLTTSNPLHDSTAYFPVASPSPSSSSSTADDSGYDSADDAHPYTSAYRTDRGSRRNVSTRESSAASHTCVMKPVRVRKR